MLKIILNWLNVSCIEVWNWNLSLKYMHRYAAHHFMYNCKQVMLRCRQRLFAMKPCAYVKISLLTISQTCHVWLKLTAFDKTQKKINKHSQLFTVSFLLQAHYMLVLFFCVLSNVVSCGSKGCAHILSLCVSFFKKNILHITRDP